MNLNVYTVSEANGFWHCFLLNIFPPLSQWFDLIFVSDSDLADRVILLIHIYSYPDQCYFKEEGTGMLGALLCQQPGALASFSGLGYSSSAGSDSSYEAAKLFIPRKRDSFSPALSSNVSEHGVEPRTFSRRKLTEWNVLVEQIRAHYHQRQTPQEKVETMPAHHPVKYSFSVDNPFGEMLEKLRGIPGRAASNTRHYLARLAALSENSDWLTPLMKDGRYTRLQKENYMLMKFDLLTHVEGNTEYEPAIILNMVDMMKDVVLNLKAKRELTTELIIFLFNSSNPCLEGQSTNFFEQLKRLNKPEVLVDVTKGAPEILMKLLETYVEVRVHQNNHTPLTEEEFRNWLNQLVEVQGVKDVNGMLILNAVDQFIVDDTLAIFAKPDN